MSSPTIRDRGIIEEADETRFRNRWHKKNKVSRNKRFVIDLTYLLSTWRDILCPNLTCDYIDLCINSYNHHESTITSEC